MSYRLLSVDIIGCIRAFFVITINITQKFLSNSHYLKSSARKFRHTEQNNSRTTQDCPAITGLSATTALVAFPQDIVFEAARAGSPVHTFDMAVVPALPALVAGSRAVVAGSKAAAGTEN